MNLTTPASKVHRAYDRAVGRFEAVIQALERRYTPLGRFTPAPFAGWQFLWQPAVLGFIALTAILVGASFSDSPFKLNSAGSWFFGVQTVPGNSLPPTNETTLMFSIVLVFGGLVLLMRVWLRLAEIVKHHKGAPVKSLWKMLALWSIPMVIAPPLFSRDVYSYAAQGWLDGHHLNPYVLGPLSIGSGPFVRYVDTAIWGNSPAPYGPLFLFLDSTVVKLSNQDVLATVVGLRLLEVAAVALLTWGLTLLARGLGRDPGEALVLGALNPLVLLTLIGGAHNDALMAALLVVGIGLAVKRHPLWGMFFCACATAVKAPAALGLVYIAWTYRGPGLNWRAKIVPILQAVGIAGATLGGFSLLAGFGFGWVRNLATPGTVRSWAAPATGVGLALSRIAHALGSTAHTGFFITLTRGIGLTIAGAAIVWLFFHAERFGWIRAIGVSLLLFVMLGPVVQPWYLVWGAVLVGVSYVGREHFWLLLLTIIGPFLGLPGGKALVHGLLNADVFAVLASFIVLAAMLLVPLGAWTQWSWPAVGSAEVRLSA